MLHHRTHIHPLRDFAGPEHTFSSPGDHDADSYFEITLNATDASGDFDAASVEIRPETIALTLASSPPG